MASLCRELISGPPLAPPSSGEKNRCSVPNLVLPPSAAKPEGTV